MSTVAVKGLIVIDCAQLWMPMPMSVRYELVSLDRGWLLLIAALISVLILWLQVSSLVCLTVTVCLSE